MEDDDGQFLEESAAVRARLGDRVLDWTDASIYRWSPVFRARLRTASDGDVDVIVKRSLRNADFAAGIAEWQRVLAEAGLPVNVPVVVMGDGSPTFRVGEQNWSAYPFIEGTTFDGSIERLAAAGTLLGRIHAASWDLDVGDRIPPFGWPRYDDDEVAADDAMIRGVIADELPLDDAMAAATTAHWVDSVCSFMTDTLPALQEANLPMTPATLDFRALNLIETGADLPVAIDFEKGERAPRIVDLAFSTLFFCCEAEANPGRLLDADEWLAFRDAYLAAAPPLTASERTSWPTALEFMRHEEGLWYLGEGAEWDLPNQRAFLGDLATCDPAARFPLA